MKSVISIGLLALVISLSACSGSNGGSADEGGIDASAVGMQGIWMQKNEADELRSTGTVEYVCQEVKKYPKRSIMNVRIVERNGTTYAYNPNIGKIKELKIGVITASKGFAPSGSFKDQLGPATIKVDIDGDVLSFTYKFGESEITMDYLRSSETEARQYYAIQEACKKQNKPISLV